MAVSAAEKALALDPSMVSAHVALRNAHRDRRGWAEAEGAYRRALDLAPDDPEANRAAELDRLAGTRLDGLGYNLTPP